VSAPALKRAKPAPQVVNNSLETGWELGLRPQLLISLGANNLDCWTHNRDGKRFSFVRADEKVGYVFWSWKERSAPRAKLPRTKLARFFSETCRDMKTAFHQD